eukprot:m.116714 g.116714  ORF g.116714 m.116714 type:complete len:365 (-) comp14241_c0_seq3:2819-3913(-)
MSLRVTESLNADYMPMTDEDGNQHYNSSSEKLTSAWDALNMSSLSPRVVSRDLPREGQPRTRRINVEGGKKWIYSHDWFHSICNVRWGTLLLIYAAVYAGTWFVFSLLYLPMTVHEECAAQTHVYHWRDSFMLSVMASSTIGFGYHYVDPSKCSGYVVVILCLQILIQLAIDCCFMGTIFVKLSRPQSRSLSLRFSKNAVIDNRGNHPQLQVRIADARKQQLCEPHVRMVLMEKIHGPDGFDIHAIPLSVDQAYIYLVLPFVARHDIDDKSPLKASLENPDSDFEIVVIVEGTENTTGLTTSRQQSYCREEIFKNHRFLPMVSPNDSLRKPIVLDFGRLSAIAPNSELGNQKTSEMVVRSSRML